MICPACNEPTLMLIKGVCPNCARKRPSAPTKAKAGKDARKRGGHHRAATGETARGVCPWCGMLVRVTGRGRLHVHSCSGRACFGSGGEYLRGAGAV